MRDSSMFHVSRLTVHVSRLTLHVFTPHSSRLLPHGRSHFRGSDIRTGIGTAKRNQVLARLVELRGDFENLVCGVGYSVGWVDQLPGASVDTELASHNPAGQISCIESH